MIRDVRKISIGDWVMQIHKPDASGPYPVMLMLHGWTGDENSMWIFAHRLPKNALFIAPRGLFVSTDSGYGWHVDRSKPWPWVDDFIPSVEALYEKISPQNFPDGDFSDFHLIGFSQGAALAYTMALIHPERISSLAGLSGFLPDGASTWLAGDRMKGLPVFITHGTEDVLVPIERARLSVDHLEKAGARVTYCEDGVGHKLSAKCFRGLEAFYKGLKQE